MKPFRRRSGQIEAVFTEQEARVLRTLAIEIGEIVASTTDPALARLLPKAYRDDDTAQAEYARFAMPELIDRKRTNAQIVAQTVISDGPFVLDDSQAASWLRTLSDIRLVIAQRLGIKADGDRGDDPQLAFVYDWLGFVQESLVTAVDGGRR